MSHLRNVDAQNQCSFVANILCFYHIFMMCFSTHIYLAPTHSLRKVHPKVMHRSIHGRFILSKFNFQFGSCQKCTPCFWRIWADVKNSKLSKSWIEDGFNSHLHSLNAMSLTFCFQLEFCHWNFCISIKCDPEVTMSREISLRFSQCLSEFRKFL